MSTLDEFGLIAHLAKRLPPSDGATTGVIVGIGDDAAVLAHVDGEQLLVTTDTMVEGVHFRKDTIPWRDLGYKIMAVSISDIAAMGGIPRHATLSLAIPKPLQQANLEAFYDGVADACKQFSCTVVGGDVVSTTGPHVVTSTVLGGVQRGAALLRSGARPGDTVFVTGPVGGSAAGLNYLLEGGPLPPDEAMVLMGFHRHPEPQVSAGQILRDIGASSCNDVSDGLASELHEIATASGVRLRIDAARIPIAPETRNFARVRREDPLAYAWYGGEDFQLVGTASPTAFARALARCHSIGIPLTGIGRVESGDGVIALTDHGIQQIQPRGYNHFSSPKTSGST